MHIMISVYYRIQWFACRAPVFQLKCTLIENSNENSTQIDLVVPLFMVTIKGHYACLSVANKSPVR
jgi:hypothetical protein